MAGGGPGGSYSKKIGCVYIFNLICGVGALMLPLAFNRAGLFLGISFLAFCAFLAFICVTYVIEVMACSNVLLRKKEQLEKVTQEVENPDEIDVFSDYEKSSSLWSNFSSRFSKSAENVQAINKNEDELDSEDMLLINDEEKRLTSNQNGEMRLFSIVTQTELGLCAEQFLGPFGKLIFYSVIIFYLYGDLAIYGVAVPKSVYQVTGPFLSLSDVNTFRLYALIFAILIIPVCFLNFSKTKYLQLVTMFLRNLALLIMIVLSLVFIIQGNGASWRDLKWFDLGGIEVLYGVTIYSFMCHHSLPGIVSPIKQKKGLGILFLLDFIAIFASYISLCYVAMFAFGNQKNPKCPTRIGPGAPCQIQELFTYNFTSFKWAPVGYFLALFPVFTLTSNFPLIAMTLRGNIITIFKDVEVVKNMHWLVQRIIFSSIATFPPMILIFFFQDVTRLASLTGGFAGLGIQFFFPAIMVFQARRKMKQVFRGKNVPNPHASWFKSFIWIEIVIGFAILGLIYQSILQGISFYKYIYDWIHA